MAHLLASELNCRSDGSRLPVPIRLIVPAGGARNHIVRRFFSTFKVTKYLPVQHYQTVSQPVGGANTSRYVRHDTESPTEVASDADSNSLAHGSALIARESSLGRLSHDIDFQGTHTHTQGLANPSVNTPFVRGTHIPGCSCSCHHC